LWGWGILGASAAAIAVLKPNRRFRAAAGMALAFVLVLVSYRVDANPWKSQFNSKYAEKLLRENAASGDAIYAGNLILAQAALDKNDPTSAKQFLLQAALTSGAKRIEQNGLDTSVARVLFDRGEKDAVLAYLGRGKTLWPQGAQLITRWEAAIKAGRRPNFNTRGPGGAGQPGGGQGQDR
jgi:predicted negative regulator of RcsB-dependent stress response